MPSTGHCSQLAAVICQGACASPAAGLPDQLRPGTKEYVPWGLPAIQATSPGVVAASKGVAAKVAYCIVDSGGVLCSICWAVGC